MSILMIRKEKERIYQQYLKAFKKGVYNYIKEEIDPVTQETIPRKYFSGGWSCTNLDPAMQITTRAPPKSDLESKGLFDLSAGRILLILLTILWIWPLLQPGSTVKQEDLTSFYYGSLQDSGILEPLFTVMKGSGRLDIQHIQGAVEGLIHKLFPEFEGTPVAAEYIRDAFQESELQKFAIAITAWLDQQAISNGKGGYFNIYFPRDAALGYTAEMALRSIRGESNSSAGVLYVSRDSMEYVHYSWVKEKIDSLKIKPRMDKNKLLEELWEAILVHMDEDSSFKEKMERIFKDIEQLGYDKHSKVRFIDSGFQTFPLMLEAIFRGKYGYKADQTTSLVVSSTALSFLPELDTRTWEWTARQAVKNNPHAVASLGNMESADNFLRHPFKYNEATHEMEAQDTENQLRAFMAQLYFVIGAMRYSTIISDIRAQWPELSDEKVKELINTWIGKSDWKKDLGFWKMQEMGLQNQGFMKDFVTTEIFKDEDIKKIFSPIISPKESEKELIVEKFGKDLLDFSLPLEKTNIINIINKDQEFKMIDIVKLNKMFKKNTFWSTILDGIIRGFAGVVLWPPTQESQETTGEKENGEEDNAQLADQAMQTRRSFVGALSLVFMGEAVARAVGNASVFVSNEGLESVPALAGNVDLNQVGNKKSFPRTGIYRIGPEIPGKPAVLFIHGAWGDPENFIEHIKELELKGEANIFVFKYDFKEALENAKILRSWLGTWAEYLRQNGNQGGIIVAHSFGNNVLIKAVEDMQPVENNYTMLQTFLQHSTVVHIAPTLNGSKVVNEFSKPVIEELGDALGFRKLRHAQTPREKNGKAIEAIQDGYGNFLDSIGHVVAIFASEDKHIGNSQEAKQMMSNLLKNRTGKIPAIVFSSIRGHYEVLNSSEAKDELSEALADRAMQTFDRRSFLKAAAAGGVVALADAVIPPILLAQGAKPNTTLEIVNLVLKDLESYKGPEIRNDLVKLFDKDTQVREAALGRLLAEPSVESRQAIIQVLVNIVNSKKRDIFNTQARKLLLSLDLSGTNFNDVTVAKAFFGSFNDTTDIHYTSDLEDGKKLLVEWLNKPREYGVFDVLTNNWRSSIKNDRNLLAQSLTEDEEPVLSLDLRTHWATAVQNQLQKNEIQKSEAFWLLRLLCMDNPKNLENVFTKESVGTPEADFFKAFAESGLLDDRPDYRDNRKSLVEKAEALLQEGIEASTGGKIEDQEWWQKLNGDPYRASAYLTVHYLAALVIAHEVMGSNARIMAGVNINDDQMRELSGRILRSITISEIDNATSNFEFGPGVFKKMKISNFLGFYFVLFNELSHNFHTFWGKAFGVDIMSDESIIKRSKFDSEGALTLLTMGEWLADIMAIYVTTQLHFKARKIALGLRKADIKRARHEMLSELFGNLPTPRISPLYLKDWGVYLAEGLFGFFRHIDLLIFPRRVQEQHLLARQFVEEVVNNQNAIERLPEIIDKAYELIGAEAVRGKVKENKGSWGFSWKGFQWAIRNQTSKAQANQAMQSEEKHLSNQEILDAFESIINGLKQFHPNGLNFRIMASSLKYVYFNLYPSSNGPREGHLILNLEQDRTISMPFILANTRGQGLLKNILSKLHELMPVGWRFKFAGLSNVKTLEYWVQRVVEQQSKGSPFFNTRSGKILKDYFLSKEDGTKRVRPALRDYMQWEREHPWESLLSLEEIAAKEGFGKALLDAGFQDLQLEIDGSDYVFLSAKKVGNSAQLSANQAMRSANMVEKETEGIRAAIDIYNQDRMRSATQRNKRLAGEKGLTTANYDLMTPEEKEDLLGHITS